MCRLVESVMLDSTQAQMRSILVTILSVESMWEQQWAVPEEYVGNEINGPI